MCEHWKRKETSSEKVLGVTFSLSALWSKKSVPSSLPQAEGTNHMGPLTRLSGSLWSQPTALALTDRWNSKGRHGDSSAGTRLQWEEATLAPTDSGEPGWSSVSCWPHLPLEKKCWPEAYKNYVQEQRGWGGGEGECLSEKEEVIVDLRAHFAPGWEVLLDVLNGEIQGTCSSTIQKSQPGARTKPRACLTWPHANQPTWPFLKAGVEMEAASVGRTEQKKLETGN